MARSSEARMTNEFPKHEGPKQTRRWPLHVSVIRAFVLPSSFVLRHSLVIRHFHLLVFGISSSDSK